MKAIIAEAAGGPEVMKLQDVPVPQPGPGQVLVKVHAAGVNPVDTYIRSGLFGAAFPLTPGVDAGGVVETVGEGVAKVKPGDRVYTANSVTGTYAEYSLAEEAMVWPLPDNIDFKKGACVWAPYHTAYRAIWNKAHAIPGQTVLVHGGSGGVGLAAIQILRAAGFTVLATAGTAAGLDLIKHEGAHHALNHHDDGYVEKIAKITGGKGPDIILEMLANVNLAKDMDIIGKGGKIIIIGNRGSIEIDPRSLMGKESQIIGMRIFEATPNEARTAHYAIFAGLESGVLRPIIRHELPLSDAPKAHELVMAPGALGRIVLIP